MVQILGNTEGKVIAAKATRSITENDYYKLVPLITNVLKQHPGICLYFEVEGFEDNEANRFWDNLAFERDHAAALDRIAIVGNVHCRQLLANLNKKFPAAEVRYFVLDQKEEALPWIKDKRDPTEHPIWQGISPPSYLQYEASYTE